MNMEISGKHLVIWIYNSRERMSEDKNLGIISR
jgi:hypothetical protein